MTEFYSLGDMPSLKEIEALDADVKDARRINSADGLHIMGEKTGVFRTPKKGDWYLSGAIPTTYKVAHDFRSEYHIMRLVLVERKTTTRLTKVVDDIS